MKRYISWSKEDLDLNDSFQRRWYIKQVLTYGRAEDIASLNWDEIKEILPYLNLPKEIRKLWEEYFANKRERDYQ
ncbi:hypothetical protein H5T89_03735 [bacterium]|nr:hypothetical protein [bacterium]